MFEMEERIYYFGSKERKNYLIRYWRRKKSTRWYAVFAFAQLLYGCTVWNDETTILIKIISGFFVPFIMFAVMALEYKTVILISKGYDMIHDHTTMTGILNYLNSEFDVITIDQYTQMQSSGALRTLYVSRYLYLLLEHYESVGMIYNRFGIQLKVDPYRDEYSYGLTRLDRYVSIEDIL